MARILAIDYGKKRVGLAVTDPLKKIANGLATVSTVNIWDYLENYLGKEKIECIVVGYPRQLNNKPSDACKYINPFIKKLKKTYSDIAVKLMDERFTSKLALQVMLESGLKKKARQNKELVDTISATIILQSYLEIILNKQ